MLTAALALLATGITIICLAPGGESAVGAGFILASVLVGLSGSSAS